MQNISDKYQNKFDLAHSQLDLSYVFNDMVKLFQPDELLVRAILLLVILDTLDRTLHPKILDTTMEEVEFEGNIASIKVVDFKSLNPFNMDNFGSENSVVFVIPNWTGCNWYKHSQEDIRAGAVRLSNQHDLFLDPKGDPLAKLPWDNWLYKASKFVFFSFRQGEVCYCRHVLASIPPQPIFKLAILNVWAIKDG